ncbi:hypothetical protein [Lacticaseibacillus parakribbianus]|uniref:hypothetical protein n=1 Tax=Lacticaseibacillus parakribbianus TaxID=2970927 RepID=UPI0021CAE774|nr:hypothetical protein [Lacticaseibacillus parakribbianus]
MTKFNRTAFSQEVTTLLATDTLNATERPVLEQVSRELTAGHTDDRVLTVLRAGLDLPAVQQRLSQPVTALLASVAGYQLGGSKAGLGLSHLRW